MRHILIFIHPSNSFPKLAEAYARIQVDRHRQLGLEPDDLLIVTNFSWSYNGLRTFVVSRKQLLPISAPLINKIAVLALLTKNGICQGRWWFHDLDVFQITRFDWPQAALKPLNLCTYSSNDKGVPQTGSMFFQGGAAPIFDYLLRKCRKWRSDSDESALRQLLEQHDPTMVSACHRWLDSSYNFGERRIDYGLSKAIGAVKAVHVHPFWESRTTPGKRRIDHLIEAGIIPNDLAALIESNEALSKQKDDSKGSGSKWEMILNIVLIQRHRFF